MSRFSVTDVALQGLKVIERTKIGDNRGFLARIYCARDLAAAGWNDEVLQINHTGTSLRGTVRGMHFQRPPHAEKKLVSCIRGEVWDVAVDLRADSPGFLSWHAEVLSADNRRALLIPEGFAHGFQALTDDVELLYCHSAIYDAASEGGLNPRDARLAIAWPLPITELSVRDSGHAPITDSFAGVIL